MKIDEEMIYLSFVRDGDKVKVVDQHGRKVARVMAVSLNSEIGEAASVTLTVRDSTEDESQPYYLDCES